MITGVQNIIGTWRTVGADIGMTPAELNQFGEAFENQE
jgi:hypothetical protein